MTEDTWRPWEHRRYEVDKAILRVEANVNLGDDYSVDFLEPNYAVTPESEIMLWSWRLDRGLATPMDYFLFYNSDSDQASIDEFAKRQEEFQQTQQTPQNRLLNILTNDNRSSS
jgi:hypothetical protein